MRKLRFLLSVLALSLCSELMAQTAPYQVGVCDWMVLKRQKLGQFSLARELACDGVELDMGGLGQRELFDNKLRDASVNVQRRQKTFEAFSKLPEEFVAEDVMRCFSLKTDSAMYMRIKRLQQDNLVEKVGEYVENGKSKARYRKTGVLMC